MKPKSLSGLVFYVNDLDISEKFYSKLGFRFEKKEDERRLAYLNWFWIEFRLNSLKQDSQSKRPSVFLKVDDVEEIYDYLISEKIKPDAKPSNLEYGRRGFSLTDPDNYQLVFFT